MAFAAPFFLIGLAALVVPIIIHLWSKNTHSSLSFGSLRFLKETETRTMRSIMPSQWLLLLFRLLLLALVVLVLAQPMIKQEVEKLQTIYLIDTKYVDSPLLKTFRDTLSDQSRLLWLATNFPDINTPVPVSRVDYWMLLSQSPKQLATRTVVVSPLLVQDFAGKKITFPVRYEWMQWPVDPVVKNNLNYAKGDNYWSVQSTYLESLTERKIEAAQSGDKILVTYKIKADTKYKKYEEVFKAAISTLNALSPLTIERVETEADWLLWFSDESVPEHAKRIAIHSSEIQPWNSITNERIQISSDWNKETAIRQKLPQKLLRVFSYDILKDQENEQLTMDAASFSYANSKEASLSEIQQDASNYVWLLLIFVLVGERWLAYKSERK